jgi:hypothetical protein
MATRTGTGKGTSLSPDEDEVVGALLALSRVFVAETARSLSGLDEDVTLPQFRTLVVLVSRGPQRVADLAQELAVTRTSDPPPPCEASGLRVVPE